MTKNKDIDFESILKAADNLMRQVDGAVSAAARIQNEDERASKLARDLALHLEVLKNTFKDGGPNT